MKILSTIPLLLMLALLAACDTTGPKEKPDEPDEPKELFPAPINEDISLLRSCCENPFNEGPPYYGTGWFYQSEWHSGKVYIILEMRELNLQENNGSFSVASEQYFEIDPVDGDGKPVSYFTKSGEENSIYFIVTNEPRKSVGELRVYDLQANTTSTLLRDSTYNISSIRIRETPDGSLLKVYYSYGNPDTGLEAGYYRLSETGPPDELLLAHSNPNGPRETINGFDLSPDGTTLLYPIHHAFVPGSAYGGPPPELATLNLETGATDTLPVHFGLQQFLWARYHPSGDSLVVGNYPRSVLEFTSVDVDSMYIVDLSDYSRRALDTRTWEAHHTSDLFPAWSPDGDYLIYGSAEVFPGNLSIGKFSVYIMDMTDN